MKIRNQKLIKIKTTCPAFTSGRNQNQKACSDFRSKPFDFDFFPK